jgi:hypothetical protein
MEVYRMLVYVLSGLFIILLIISIVVVFYVFKIVKTFKELSDKAADVVESASEIRKFVSPAATGRVIFEAVQKMVKHHDKKNKR